MIGHLFVFVVLAALVGGGYRVVRALPPERTPRDYAREVAEVAEQDQGE